MDKMKFSRDQFSFELIAQDGKARAGILSTPHGKIETPIFMPVGTQATVKSLTPAQLDAIDVQILLSNTYHLYLRPGADVIAKLGGLHNFMCWPKPILTDSGGFQVFSLGGLRKIDEDGVLFKSHIDGSTHKFTPEFAVEIQEKLGADIIMAFDECPNPLDKSYNQQALERTHRWAERCLRAKSRPDQAMFGIVQGGIFSDLRQSSAEFLSSLDFPGYAIGGLSVGEGKADMHAAIEIVNQILPENKPRYLMGVGTPVDLVECVFRGIDMFDCVLPTRLARHHAAQTMHGRLNLANSAHNQDSSPIDPDCGCYTCTHFSRAYLRHLINSKEMLAATLLSIHNIYTLIHLTRNIRQSIIEQRFTSYRRELLSILDSDQELSLKEQ